MCFPFLLSCLSKCLNNVCFASPFLFFLSDFLFTTLFLPNILSLFDFVSLYFLFFLSSLIIIFLFSFLYHSQSQSSFIISYFPLFFFLSYVSFLQNSLLPYFLPSCLLSARISFSLPISFLSFIMCYSLPLPSIPPSTRLFFLHSFYSCFPSLSCIHSLFTPIHLSMRLYTAYVYVYLCVCLYIYESVFISIYTPAFIFIYAFVYNRLHLWNNG